MKRSAAKCTPKHVRRAVARLGEAGHRDVAVRATRHGLRLEWTVAGLLLRCTALLHDGGNAFEQLWASIRALFRQRGLEVPA